MKNKIKKIFSGWLVVLIVSSLIAPGARADVFDIGNWTDFDPLDPMNDIIGDLGIDKDELKYSVQTMNVARQKKAAPQVKVTFEPFNPTPGERVTALATPIYFLNDVNDLYYTWFLKMDGCEKSSSPTSAQRKKCDLDSNGRVDIEDWKIKAMRIIANDDFNWEGADYSQDSDNDGYSSVHGGDDQRGKNEYCYVHDTSTGDEYTIDCEDRKDGHLFPHAPGETTGDNSFGRDEEKFWHTDPNANDTGHTGNVDEANVAGLGINQFTWNYSEGDEVGVVVEGVSIEPTQTEDASYRTMWAMPVSMCDVEVDEIEDYPSSTTVTVSETEDSPLAGQTTTVTQTTAKEVTSRAANIATITTTVTTTTTVTDSTTGEQISQSSSSTSSTSIVDIRDKIKLKDIDEVSDLNECLYDNLISPAENGAQSDKLEVSLSYFPTSPINDPRIYSDLLDSEGDDLVVNSSVTNANDVNYVQYKWEVFESDEANPESWGDPIVKSRLPGATQMAGIGLDSFKFKLNMPNPKKFLKVKATVKENVGNNLFREGYDYVVVPVNSTQNRIRAYGTVVSNPGAPRIELDSTEICSSGLDRAVCPVAKNEIIGLTASSTGLTDFLWTIDGKPFTYQSCFFEGCSEDKQTNVAYFPILKEKGERYKIGLTATDRSTGSKISLNRIFEVIEPEMSISSANESTCKPVLLGSYIDLDGKKWKDYSKLNFWALTGSPIELKAETIGFSASADKFIWSVDGMAVNASNADSLGFSIDSNGILTLPPKKDKESYNISVGTVYSQSDLVKQALNKYWGVSYDQFYEKMVTKNIAVTMQESAPLEAQAPSEKIFATVYSAAPSYLMFLLRITITAFLMIFVSRVIMSFSLTRQKE